MVIYGYFKLLLVIFGVSPWAILCVFYKNNLFHLRLFLVIISFFAYCRLFYFKLLATIINYLWVF
jgi:hypothetical protein